MPPPSPSPPPGRLRLTNEGLVWLGAAAVLGAVGWFKGLNPLILFAYGMAALLVVNGVLARRQARRVHLLAPPPVPPVYPGEPARVVAGVRNESGRAVAGVTLTPADDPARVWLWESLPAGTDAEAIREVAFPRRGRYRLPPPVVGSGYPFGLLRYDRPGTDGVDVVVLPAVGEIDPEGLRRWVARGAGGDDRNRRVLRRATADQADVRGVRPYRAGDSIRWVHWRSSARRGELMVREYDAAPTPELVVAVEPWLPPHHTPADRDRLEASLSLAATVLRAWCTTLDARASLLVLGGEPVARAIAAGGAAVRDGLVPLADAVGAASFPAVGPGAFGRIAKTAARMLVSSRPDSPAAADLARAAGRPFVAVDPSARPAWYFPPGGA